MSAYLIITFLPVKPKPIPAPLLVPPRHQHAEGVIVIHPPYIGGVAADRFLVRGELQFAVADGGEDVAEVIGEFVAFLPTGEGGKFSFPHA
ncbi:MAG: hypothetical protein R3C61_28470 [Bacteroidia bacterium]